VTQYDLIIRNGLIVDGTRQRGYSGDVAITNGRIGAVGVVEKANRKIKSMRPVFLSRQDLLIFIRITMATLLGPIVWVPPPTTVLLQCSWAIVAWDSRHAGHKIASD
jgi:hypothetical protein